MRLMDRFLTVCLSALLMVTALAVEGMAQCTNSPVEAPTKPVACPFDKQTLQFNGTAQEQALCLLRPVAIRARLGPPLAQLPQPLHTLVGNKVTQLDKQKFEAFVSTSGLTKDSLGGSLDQPLSRANQNAPTADFARYFVIHDTSTCPGSNGTNCPATQFPPNADEASWSGNSPKTWAGSKDAHLYITRDGQLVAPQGRTFSVPWRATKLELNGIGLPACGLFLHVENIQPRHTDPKGAKGNDNIAPVPGFTQRQLRLLAMSYVAASLRSGTWLIPAYHAVLDTGFGDGHDDPQNFDLAKWAAEICDVIGKANGSGTCSPPS